MESDDEDPCSEQVLVAALPGAAPEIHLASLDRTSGSLSLRVASVRPSGELSLGSEKLVSLAAAGSVDVSDGVVAVLGSDGNLLIQMHLEAQEDQETWAEGIRSLIKARSEACIEGDHEDVTMLQARSRQLQNRIGALEAIGERRDKQLQKMMRRLDGAMQMLAAVQDMCSQQRKVIAAQSEAIGELRRECGQEDDGHVNAQRAGQDTNTTPNGGAVSVVPPPPQEASRPLVTTQPQAEEQDGEQNSSEGEEEQDGEQSLAEAEAEIAAKAEQMLKLLQQADEMQRALSQLESLGEAQLPALAQRAAPAGAEAVGDRRAIAAALPPASPLPRAPAPTPAPEGDGAEEAVLERLRSLDEEKRRFEGMLEDSQQEHQELLQRLASMQSLMRGLGMKDDENESERDDGEAAGVSEAGHNDNR